MNFFIISINIVWKYNVDYDSKPFCFIKQLKLQLWLIKIHSTQMLSLRKKPIFIPEQLLVSIKDECMYILSTKAINYRNCSLFFGASKKCDTYSSDSLFSVVFDIPSFTHIKRRFQINLASSLQIRWRHQNCELLWFMNY